MKHILTLFLAATLSVALFAQNGPSGPPTPTGFGSKLLGQAVTSPLHSLDPAAVTVIAGTVSTVNLAVGVQHPSIVISGKTIELAPVWWMLERGLEIKEGDNLAVKAAPCLDPAKTMLFAIEVRNVTTGTTLALRDANGLPLWITRGGRSQGQQMNSGAGNGTADCSGCFDPASVVTASGTVESVNAGLGIQMPTLTLKTSKGLVTIKIGPTRILLEAGFVIKAGDALTITYGQSVCTDEWIALSLKNAAGETVTLRDPTGRIAW